MFCSWLGVPCSHSTSEFLFTMANEIGIKAPQGAQAADSITPGAWQAKEQKIVTNVISIQETKEAMDKTEELLKTFLGHVQQNEPGCQLFLLTRDDERFQFVTFEMYYKPFSSSPSTIANSGKRYENKQAVDIHLHTEYIRTLIHAQESQGLKRAANDIHHESLVAQIGPRNLGT